MNHTYIQLELFLVPALAIDEEFGEEMTSILIKQLQDRKKRITHLIIHPSTLSRRLPNFNDRTTWERASFTDVAVNKKRLKSFDRSTKCSCCGREGNAYVIEEDVNNPQGGKYLNLYHVTDTTVVEMTIDHTLPKSFGGADTAFNRATMCFVCNQEKANVLTVEEIKRILPNLKKHIKEWANEEYIKALLNLQMWFLESKKPADSRRAKATMNKYISYSHPGTKPQTYQKALKEIANIMYGPMDPSNRQPAPEPVVVKSGWFDNIVVYVRNLLGK